MLNPALEIKGCGPLILCALHYLEVNSVCGPTSKVIILVFASISDTKGMSLSGMTLSCFLSRVTVSSPAKRPFHWLCRVIHAGNY